MTLSASLIENEMRNCSWYPISNGISEWDGKKVSDSWRFSGLSVSIETCGGVMLKRGKKFESLSVFLIASFAWNVMFDLKGLKTRWRFGFFSLFSRRQSVSFNTSQPAIVHSLVIFHQVLQTSKLSGQESFALLPLTWKMWLPCQVKWLAGKVTT